MYCTYILNGIVPRHLLIFITVTSSIENMNQKQPNHYGRNTHFKQIYFAVPNFNFIYIYIKLKKLRDTPRIFLKKYAKTSNQRKLRK